jgi:flagellar basal body-associated protein FliL
MKWNDIQKHVHQVSPEPAAPTNDQVVSPQPIGDQKKHGYIRWIFLALIIAIIVLAVIALIKLFTNKQSQKPVLPVEQLQQVTTFLDTNPPAPLTNVQGQIVNDTINKPVQLNDADMQSINSFLQQ